MSGDAINVAIVGGGFAGLAAARTLAGARGVRVTLIDPRASSHFLPLLPDVIGRAFKPELLEYPFVRAARRWGFSFVQAEVSAVDFSARLIVAGACRIAYDFAVLAAGATTSFFGRDDLRSAVFTLDSVDEARRLAQAVDTGAHEHFVIVGGGYTGIEAATSIRRRSARLRRVPGIHIIDVADGILGSLPECFRRYALANLVRMGIEVLPKRSLERIEGDAAVLSCGTRYDHAGVVWVTGRETPRLIASLPVAKDRQGRLIVDEHLRVNERCFAAGDAAHVGHAGRPWRMGAQCALSQGGHAARSILRARAGRPLKRFNPLDPGYVIPMANGRSCGAAMGVNIYGWPPTVLHYLMSAYRSWGGRNRLGVSAASLAG